MNFSSRVLVVEDEVIIAEYLHDLLVDIGYQNVVTAYTFEAAMHEINENNPSIILLDINLDGNFEGLEIAKSISDRIPFVFLTAQTEMSIVNKANSFNPVSYLTKPFKNIDLIIALNLCEKKCIKDDFDSKLNSEYLTVLKNTEFIDDSTATKSHCKDNLFSERELEVLQLICQQKTAFEIAAALNISPRTVDGHRNRLLEKTDSKNIIGLVVFAIQNKYCTL